MKTYDDDYDNNNNNNLNPCFYGSK